MAARIDDLLHIGSARILLQKGGLLKTAADECAVSVLQVMARGFTGDQGCAKLGPTIF